MKRAALLLVVLTLTGCGGGGGEEPVERPDVTLVLIDTLRRDHLQVYGYQRDTSPFLLDLAQRGVVFDRAHSTSSWTAPSTATVLTGLYPPRHGIVLGHNAYGRKTGDEETDTMSLNAIPGGLSTLPELLSAAGYQTFGVASNINVDPARGFARGFDRFERIADELPAENLATILEAWIGERDPDRPAFWYLHVNDPHKPYTRRKPWYKRPRGFDEHIARYDSEIGYVDHVLEGLSEPLGWDESIVVVVADHGEEFMDHGAIGHRARLYAELMNVPFLVSAPGFEGGLRREEPVSLIDVLPTVADLVGLELDQECHGRSLVPLMRAGGSLSTRTLFGHRLKPLDDRPVWAVVSGPWKLIVNEQEDTIELFDVLADPTEQENLADQRPDEVARLEARLEAFRAIEPMPTETIEVEMDEDLRRRLDGLGYGGGGDEDDD